MWLERVTRMEGEGERGDGGCEGEGRGWGRGGGEQDGAGQRTREARARAVPCRAGCLLGLRLSECGSVATKARDTQGGGGGGREWK